MSTTRRIILATLALTAILLTGNQITPVEAAPTDAFAIAASYNVTVVRDTSQCPVADPGHFSCFSPKTPNVVYVTMEAPDSVVQYLVLHQLGHLLENRNGEEQNECRADAFVQQNGINRHPRCVTLQD